MAVDPSLKAERIGSKLTHALEVAHTAHAESPPGLDTEIRYLHRKIDAVLDAVLSILPMAAAGDAAVDFVREVLDVIATQNGHISSLVTFEEKRRQSET